MKIKPSYLARSTPLTEEEEAAISQAKAEAEAARQAAIELKSQAEARANGATVSLSDRSLSALALDDQRLRSNIQWGVARGLLLYSVLMIPVGLILGLIIANSR
jgi:hypothetical protein